MTVSSLSETAVTGLSAPDAFVTGASVTGLSVSGAPVTGAAGENSGIVRAYVGLGSNLEDPLEHVRTACRELDGIRNTRVAGCSPLYRTPPVGPQDQDDFVNGVAALDTSLDPLELLDALQVLEAAHRRVRLRHWGPRTLDLDLLLYGGRIITHPRLTVPHPEMRRRAFVLVPLRDLAQQLDPDLRLPTGESLEQLLSSLPPGDLKISPVFL